MQQPYWPYEQEPEIIQKRGFFAFNFMPDKLTYPGDNKYYQT